MKTVSPKVHVVARTLPDDDAIYKYLRSIEAVNYASEHAATDPEDLVEFAGRMCYRSWEPGLNPNVNKVRANTAGYLENILKSGHGSVLEHVSFTFIFQDVSRVFTHELVRHRPGVAVSQESLRYVRLDEIPFWFPDWVRQDLELYQRAYGLLAEMEKFQSWMTDHFQLDEEGVGFGEKKHKTSFMRRFAPEGLATSITWTANARTLRHVIETRTAPGAEEEIRQVFGDVARRMKDESPMLFGDFEEIEGSFIPKWRKV